MANGTAISHVWKKLKCLIQLVIDQRKICCPSNSDVGLAWDLGTGPGEYTIEITMTKMDLWGEYHELTIQSQLHRLLFLINFRTNQAVASNWSDSALLNHSKISFSHYCNLFDFHRKCDIS